MNPLPADDDDRPPARSLWRDLSDGTAGGYVRLIVCLAVGVFLAGAAMMAAYLLAAVVPACNRTFYNYMGPGAYRVVQPAGVYPRDSVVAGMMMLAGAVWMGCILWLFFRGARQGALARPVLLTVVIVILATGAGTLADSSLRGDQELVVVGIALIAAAAAVLIWVQAIRQMRTGRPLRHHQDKLLDIRCPECGYRMVGLHESRCPECGRLYTLDELLARQNFARPEGASGNGVLTVPPPVPPLPPVAPPGVMAGQTS